MHRCIKSPKVLTRDTSTSLYHTSSNALVNKKEQTYIDSLHIPKQWSPAYICNNKNKLEWVAQDSKGKWQYKYSAQWRTLQEEKKIQRLHGLDMVFWKSFKKRLAQDLEAPKNTKTYLLAVAASLLHVCNFRAGNPRSDNYGLTTLKQKHLISTNDGTLISFIGKSKQENKCLVTNKDLISKLNDLNQDSIFSKINLIDLRKYLASIRADLRPKDFRTYTANYILFDILRHTQPTLQTLKSRHETLKNVYKTASIALNNTTGVVKRAYIYKGFSDMYLNNPEVFSSIAFNKTKKTADIMNDFISRN
jgi:DNA topoisomerase IB